MKNYLHEAIDFTKFQFKNDRDGNGTVMLLPNYEAGGMINSVGTIILAFNNDKIRKEFIEFCKTNDITYGKFFGSSDILVVNYEDYKGKIEIENIPKGYVTEKYNEMTYKNFLTFEEFVNESELSRFDRKIPLYLNIYRNAKSMSYLEFSIWLNSKMSDLDEITHKLIYDKANKTKYSDFVNFIKVIPEFIKEGMSRIPVDYSIDVNIDKQIIRSAIIAEYDAINLYEQMANNAKSNKVKKVLLDIAREEKTHVGEFESLIIEMDVEHAKELKNGKNEVKNIN